MTPVKTASTPAGHENTPRIRPVCEVRLVLLVLAHDRLPVVARFRAAGGDLDRWRSEDWALMACELTRLEGELEMKLDTPARRQRRVELQALRRALEDAEDAHEQRAMFRSKGAA